MTTAITELQTLLASHPFVWLGAGITAIALALSIALWRTQLSFGAKVEGSMGSGGRLEAWVRFGPLGTIFLREPDGLRHRVMTFAGYRCFDRVVVASKKPSRRSRRRTPRAHRKSGFDLIRSIRRHWSLSEIAKFAWSRRRDFHCHALAGRIEVGFEHPDHTGEFYGACCSLTPLVPRMVAGDDGSFLAGNLTLVPNWSLENHLSGHLRVRMDIRLIRLGLLTAWFLATHWHRAPRRSRWTRHGRVAAA